MKRGFDFLLATISLLILWPVILVLAVWVRLDSPGPAFHIEQRLGWRGKAFRIYILRTLRANTGDQSPIAASNDPRITRLGRWLRPSHLDELPQLLNIVRGDMSLVGPRPAKSQLWEGIEDNLRQRALAFRPGLTSPASIRFNCEDELLNESDEPELLYRDILFPARVKMDVKYFERGNRTGSPIDDFKLILATVPGIVLARERQRCRKRVMRLLEFRSRDTS